MSQFQIKLALSKHGRICPLASPILQKITRIFKYNVFWKSIFDVFFVIVSTTNYNFKA